jgi:hypothetical protein
MKKCIFSIIAAGALASAASAQLYTVAGGTTGVTAEFTFTIDDVANTVTVFVDNTILGENGAQGTITTFGFNTPFATADLGADGSNVSFTQDFGDMWNMFAPYELSPTETFAQDFGVGSGPTEEGGNPQNGIEFGSTGTFVFTFPDFTGTDSIAGWLGEDGLSVRFQEVLDSMGVSGQSDKVFGNPDDGGGGGGGVVPEPSTYGLLGAMALLGIAAMRYLRHQPS